MAQTAAAHSDGIALEYAWDAAPNVPATKLALRRMFPGWSIIYTDRERWWAIRYPINGADGYPVQHAVSDVIADDADGLAERLRKVEAREKPGVSWIR